MLPASGALRYRGRMQRVPLVHRGEFVDALAALRRGQVIVVLTAEEGLCLLDGVPLRWSFAPLLGYGLVAEYSNPAGFEGAHYYRLTSTGRRFADDALAAWRTRPLLERLVIRLLG
jgi:hypothetical protein